jgi:hypothetical protein
MAAYVVPFGEPLKLTAGDRVQWKVNLESFPVSEDWTITYHLRANVPGGIFNIEADDSGSDYEIDIDADETATWPAGKYYWEAYASKSGDRKKVGSGVIEVLPNFSTIETPHDGRTTARMILDSIDAVMKNRATHDQQRYVMQACGRSVDKVPIADLLKFRDYWLTQVLAEESAANGGKGKNVFMRFNL